MSALIDYNDLQATVSSLIADTGTVYQLVRPDPSGDLLLANQVYGTFDKQLQDRFSATGGGVVSMAKKTLLVGVIKNGKVEPAIGDRLIQGSQNWRIDSVQVERPDGVTTILYTLDIS